jgi:hypothetical protein
MPGETINAGNEGWKTKVLDGSKWRAMVEAVKVWSGQ